MAKSLNIHNTGQWSVKDQCGDNGVDLMCGYYNVYDARYDSWGGPPREWAPKKKLCSKYHTLTYIPLQAMAIASNITCFIVQILTHTRTWFIYTKCIAHESLSCTFQNHCTFEAGSWACMPFGWVFHSFSVSPTLTSC